MNIISMTAAGRCEAAIEALRVELGGILAERAIEAEQMDFLWEARLQERYLGEHVDLIGYVESSLRTLSRVAFLSVLEGAWYAGMCLVDGEGFAVELLWKRQFPSFEDAEFALLRAR